MFLSTPEVHLAFFKGCNIQRFSCLDILVFGTILINASKIELLFPFLKNKCSS